MHRADYKHRRMLLKIDKFPVSLRLTQITLAGAMGLCFAVSLREIKADTPAQDQPIYAWTAANVDADALAGRIKQYQDIYPKLRDEALSAYAHAHPDSQPYDADAKKLIKLIAYLYLWGDIYREGLWHLADQEAQKVKTAGAVDPIIDFLPDINADATSNDFNAADVSHRAEAFAGTTYPDLFKEWYYQAAIDKLTKANTNTGGPSLAELLQKWGQLYRQQIKKSLPNTLLFGIAKGLESSLADNDDALTQLDKEADQAFADTAPGNPVQAEIDGNYLTDEAWIARSSDWASNVTDAQWAKFRQYLAKADDVLEAAYAKHPEEAEISVLMLTVELGQGQGRDRMEQWFQRAIQADPQDGAAYSAKFWYLQPRWYGSQEALVSFGQECLNLPEPPSAALGAFAVAISQASDQDPDIYKRDVVWEPIEKNYRLFLTRFPQSTFFRTAFAKHAAQSGRWKIAKEQFDLLGDNWDRSTLTEAAHARYVELANANPNTGGPQEPSPSQAGSNQPVTLFSLLEQLIGFIFRSIF